MLGKKKPKIVSVDGKDIELQPKPGIGSKLFQSQPQQQPRQPLSSQQMPQYGSGINPISQARAGPQKRPGRWHLFIEGIGAKHKGLEQTLKDQGIKGTLYSFVERMIIAAMAIGFVLGITFFVLFLHLGLLAPEAAVIAILLGFVVFYMGMNMFLNFPKHKTKKNAKGVEKDILFAARDMIIALRSGMPLFNTLVSISSGYGDASREFQKVVERVQLGMPLEEAIDQTIAESKSDSFKRIMLQASVSIKSGGDVVSAIQSVIDQLSEERVIELRRYGQRLNAIAMFYMLFGVILPSMGIAVVTILTTFIALFTVTPQLLEAGLIAIGFLQIVFLQMIRGSRPSFST
jgi:pilus assembly protein TadC